MILQYNHRTDNYTLTVPKRDVIRYGWVPGDEFIPVCVVDSIRYIKKESLHGR